MNLSLLSRAPWAFGCVLLAVMAPTLVAFGESPSITFYNQAVAVLGWGCLLVALAPFTRWQPTVRGEKGRPWSPPFMALSVVLLGCAGAALGSVWGAGPPGGKAVMAAGLLALAWWVMASAWRASDQVAPTELMALVCQGMAWTGVAAVVLSAIQVFWPEWADGVLVARPSVAGRAVGNLRQPNHLSTLLVWSACAGIWLARSGRWPRWAGVSLLLLATAGVVWSASRTGMVGMFLLTLWAVRDRHLPALLRRVTLAAPLWYGLGWAAMAVWARGGSGHAFAAAARLHDGSDISSSRFGIWANAWSLVKEQPWTGVGWGQFNLAWSLSAFPGRPVAFFDHTHNLLLQWAVEMGLPVAALLTILTAWALWVLWMPWRRVGASGVRPAAAVIVSMAGLHSLLEYPLWYSYFLLPVAFVWGVGLIVSASPGSDSGSGLKSASTQPLEGAPTGPSGRTPRFAWWPGLVVVLVAVWLLVDFQWAANVYAPRPGAGPLPQRIQAAQQRFWFGHEADYAAVMKKNNGGVIPPPSAFRRTLRNLVDDRLMMAYAESLATHGEIDKARHIVGRLREFHTGATLVWLERTCGQASSRSQPGQAADTDPDDEGVGDGEPGAGGGARPSPPPTEVDALTRAYACEPPQGHYRWWQVTPR